MVVIVGGGPIGVETAATLSSVTDVNNIMLVTANDRLLSDFPPRASRIAERVLQRKVDLRTGVRVTEVTANSVLLDGEDTEQTNLTIWAGGVRLNPIIKSFDLERTDHGLRVDSHLRCSDSDDVYAAGDVVDYPGKIKDGYAAGLEARTTAKNICRELQEQSLKQHDMRLHPRVVYLGGDTALVTLSGVVHQGRGPKLFRDLAIKGYPFYWRHMY